MTGWRPGDRVLITGTKMQAVPDEGRVPSVREHPATEERTIRSIAGNRVALDSAAGLFAHRLGQEARRGR